jgi:hypothetical protein
MNVQADEATAHGTPIPRQRAAGAPELHAFGYAFVVTARTGRLSSQVIVTRCPFRCGGAHRFTGTPLFLVGKRKAPCTGLPFVLHALPQTGEVAA